MFVPHFVCLIVRRFYSQYFSETAHNPETNQRPGRLKTAMTSGSELRFHRTAGRDSSPIYQNVWGGDQHGNSHHHGYHNRGTGAGTTAHLAGPAATRFVSPHRTPAGTRRSSSIETGSGGASYPHHRNRPTSSAMTLIPAAGPGNPNGRHSMDVGVTCRDALLLHQQQQQAADTAPAASGELSHHHLHYHHHHHHHQQEQQHHYRAEPDDSVIMSRIKKSLEQKEEFLRRPAAPSPQQQQQLPAAKEFYSRPQKLSAPVWPPSLQAAAAVGQPSQQCVEPSAAAAAATTVQDLAIASAKPKAAGKQFVNTLGKIHEDGGDKSRGAPDAAEHPKQSAGSAAVPQVVSMRAKQFESGKMDDKTDFYKSELARLTSKHNVPNVAVRKMEYEQKLQPDKKQPSSAARDVTNDSVTSCSGEYTTRRDYSDVSRGFFFLV